MEIIQQHNQEYDEGKHTWYMGINSLADWTPQEFMNRNNLRIPQTNDDALLGESEPPFLFREFEGPVPSMHAHEDDGDTHATSYSTKRFANSTRGKRSVDWRKKVKSMRTTILNSCGGSIIIGQYPM